MDVFIPKLIYHFLNFTGLLHSDVSLDIIALAKSQFFFVGLDNTFPGQRLVASHKAVIKLHQFGIRHWSDVKGLFIVALISGKPQLRVSMAQMLPEEHVSSIHYETKRNPSFRIIIKMNQFRPDNDGSMEKVMLVAYTMDHIWDR